jgi:tetratricopeptide (TPR) repeat protein
MEDLARAFYWDGEEEQALEILDELFLINPYRRSANDLYREIRNKDSEQAKSEIEVKVPLSKVVLSKDPLIEQARTKSRENQHQEAIKLFEEFRQKYPERSEVILFELADQYKFAGRFDKAITLYKKLIKDKTQDPSLYAAAAQAMLWSGKPKEALNLYQKALAIDPNHISALIGKAETLSALDRLEEAHTIYEKILNIEPNNFWARMGRARVTSWLGRFKEAINYYKKILKDYPKNPDVMEDLARAFYWDGEEEQALEILDEFAGLKNNKKSVLELKQEILDKYKPYLFSNNKYSEDNYNNTIHTYTVGGGYYPRTSTAIEAVYEKATYKQKVDSDISKIYADKVGLGLKEKLSNKLNIESYLYGVEFKNIDFNFFAADAWITYKIIDQLKLSLGYERWVYNDIASLENKIFINSGTISLNYRPNRFWTFNTQYQHSNISDHNKKDLIDVSAEYRLFKIPYTTLYYTYNRFEMSNPDIYNGYWNPNSFQSHKIGTKVDFSLTDRLSLRTEVAGSYAIIKEGTPLLEDKEWGLFASCGLRYYITDNFSVDLYGEFFDAEPERDDKKGYSKKEFYVNFKYHFGASFSKEVSTTDKSSRAR